MTPYLSAEIDMRLAISIKDQTQDGYRDIKRLKAAGLGEGRTMERKRDLKVMTEDRIPWNDTPSCLPNKSQVRTLLIPVDWVI